SWPQANAERCTAPPRSTPAPPPPAARLGGGGAVDDRGGRGNRADRFGGASLPGRRLLAVAQRPRPSPPVDRRGGARAARPSRTLHHARPLPPGGGRARCTAGEHRPGRPQSGLLLGLGVDGGRGRAQDGLSVLAAPRPPAPPP